MCVYLKSFGPFHKRDAVIIKVSVCFTLASFLNVHHSWNT